MAAKPEAHFALLLEALVTTNPDKFVLGDGTVMELVHRQVDHALEIIALVTQHGVTVQRQVLVTDIDRNDNFSVTLIQNAVNPTIYMLERSKRDYSAVDNQRSTEFWIEQVRRFVYKGINPNTIPTPEQIQTVLDINKDYLDSKHARVELYLRGGEFGDDWVHRIVAINNDKVICDHLFAEFAHGHTYRMIVDTYERAFNAGVSEGLILAVEATTRDMAKKLLDLIPDPQDKYSSPLLAITRPDNPPILQRK